MSEYFIHEYKGYDYRPFEKYVGQIVKVKVDDDNRGIIGRLSCLTDHYIELVHVDGRSTLIRISRINVISKVRVAV